MRRTLIAAAVLVTLLLLAAVTLLVVLPRLAAPAGPNPYPAPSVSEPAGCDAYDALAQTPPLPSMGKVGAALDEARKPWIEVDRSKLADVTERLGLGAAAAAFAAAKVCPAFEDHPERAVVVHGVLRAALLSLVARELAVPGSARADLLDYLRLTTERGHAARSTLGLGSALQESTEALHLLARAGIARPAESVARRNDGGRVVRVQLTRCHEMVGATLPQLGFDPKRTFEGCVQYLGPWIEHFERGTPKPPDYELGAPSFRNRDGDVVISAFASFGTMFSSTSTAFERQEQAEAQPMDPVRTAP